MCIDFLGVLFNYVIIEKYEDLIVVLLQIKILEFVNIWNKINVVSI